MDGHCWRCFVFVRTKASILCPECHKKEMERVHKHDTPTTSEVSVLGRYEPPPHRFRRPGIDGRRVIKSGRNAP